jgi:bile acid-coenzyme A ligase
MIVTGGSNVYCAEVEQAITSHPSVLDAAVIGLPDPDWGRRVHAVVEPRSGVTTLTEGELDRHTRRLLAPHKVPKTWEFVDHLPRDESGKLRRTAMLDARLAPSAAGKGSAT